MSDTLDLSSAAGAGTDWATLYQAIEAVGHVPAVSGASIDSRDATFRAMYLNLAEVQQQIAAAGAAPTHVILYADVLEIPAGVIWPLKEASLLVYARRIEADPSAAIVLDYRSSASSKLVLFAGQIEGSLTVRAVSQDLSTLPITFALGQADLASGVLIQNAGGGPARLALAKAQGLPMSPTPDFELAMTTAFIFASLIYDDNPRLALEILTWVRDWSAASRDLVDLFMRSSSLATLLSAQISARASGAAFVPYLTATVYTTLASAFTEEARQYEQVYLSLNTQKVLTDEGLQFARALRDNAIYQSQYVSGLLAQANANYANANAAVAAAEANLRQQQIEVSRVAIHFQEVGLPEYRERKIAEAVFGMATAIVTFAGAIAEMSVGDEAAAPQAAESAITAVKAVTDAAEAGKALSDTMASLKKVMTSLKAVYELSAAVLAAARNVTDATTLIDGMRSTELNAGDDIGSADAWPIFALRADGVLDGAIEGGVGYAKEYREALDILAIYGASLVSAQVAAIQAAQECARVLLQQQLAQRQQARLAQLVDSLTRGQAPIALMMQQFYQRYLDAKSSLYAALQNYRAAYFYWALAPSIVQPKVVDPIDELESGLESLTAITLDNAAALSRFDPPPAPNLGKNITIVDPGVLAALQKTRTATVTIPENAAPFLGLNRVRVDTVRVWLQGARTAYGTRISVRISSSGNYTDRNGRDRFRFVSKPLSRVFEYHTQGSQSHEQQPAWTFDNGDLGFIEIDGSIDNEVKYAYFQPTPFTEWTVSVDPATNPNVDLSSLSGLTFQFRGSVVEDVVSAS